MNPQHTEKQLQIQQDRRCPNHRPMVSLLKGIGTNIQPGKRHSETLPLNICLSRRESTGVGYWESRPDSFLQKNNLLKE
jgi:hypothetical protein